MAVCRYDNFVNDMIATKTLAQEGAVLDALAAGAAAQRFVCAALAYAALATRSASARDVVRSIAEARSAVAKVSGDGAASAAMRAAVPIDEHPWIWAHLPEPDLAAAPDGATAAFQGDAAGLLRDVETLMARVGAERSDPLQRAGPGLSPRELQAEIETLVAERSGLRVSFDAASALQDLARLGLVQLEGFAVRGWLDDSGMLSADVADRRAASEDVDIGAVVANDDRLLAVPAREAEQRLQATWSAILESSVTASLAAIL